MRELILAARSEVARTVNAGLTILYWQVGDRIRREILKEKRAQYGAEIVSALGRQLESEFGRGFAEKNLRRMVQFADVFPDRGIVVSLIRELTWTHFIALIPLKDPSASFSAPARSARPWRFSSSSPVAFMSQST